MSRQMSKFSVLMNSISIVSTIFAAILWIIVKLTQSEIISMIAITFLTIAFHFDIRLLIGNIIPKYKNRININHKYYQTKQIEKKIYKKLKVKEWKSKVPSYDLDEFNINKCSIEEIIINMCNSEIIHSINFILSYIPIIFSIWFGEIEVFIITSVLASIYDLQFVILQRYNRPRFFRILNRKQKS